MNFTENDSQFTAKISNKKIKATTSLFFLFITTNSVKMTLTATILQHLV